MLKGALQTVMKLGEKNRKRVFLYAFLLNLVCAGAAIIPFIVRDHGYFTMSNDFSALVIPNYILMNDAVKSGEIWNWGIDLGANLLESSMSASPFFLITLLFPSTAFPRLVGWILILKFAVTGLCAAVYLEHHLKEEKTILIGTILYAFSGFQCSVVDFYFFHDFIAFFPLLLFGLEELVEDNRFGRLLVACVLSLLCSGITVFYGQVLFLVLYFVTKYIVPVLQEKNWKKFATRLRCALRCITEGGLALCVTAIVVFPQLSNLLGNPRASDSLEGYAWFGHSTEDVLAFIQTFFLPAQTMSRYAAVYHDNWYSRSAYLPMVGIVLVLAYLYRKHDWLSLILKCCAAAAVIPILNSAFMGFSREPYCRWYYMFVLLMTLASMKELEDGIQKNINKAGIISVIIVLCYIGFLCLVPWDASGRNIIFHNRQFWTQNVIAFVGILLTMILCTEKKRLSWLLACVMCCGSLCLGLNIFWYQKNVDNTKQDFSSYENSYAENIINYTVGTARELRRDVLPYRYFFDEGIGHTYYNIAMCNTLPSINSFTSTPHNSVFTFYDAIGLGRHTWTKHGPIGTKELLGAKYVISTYEMTGLKPIKTVCNDNGQVLYYYENREAIPLGATYDSYILRSEFDQLPTEMRSLMMTRALVIDDLDQDKIVSIRHDDAYADVGMEELVLNCHERSKKEPASFSQIRNGFTCTIVSDKNQYSFFSVPYDSNWIITANGAKIDALNVNGLIAIPVLEGINQVRFLYSYDLLKFSVLFTVVGITVWSGYGSMMIRKKKKIKSTAVLCD